MLGLAPASAHAGGNFPPIAAASADPQEALVGETIVFSSAGSLDPDMGPEPLSFSWDFGDGATSDEESPSHAYGEMGVFVVTLTVSDGLAQALTSIAVVTLGPPTKVPPSASGPLALSPDRTTLAVANADSGSVSLVTTDEFDVDEFDVGAAPRGVAFTNDGTQLLVACRDAGELWVLDATDGSAVDMLPMGHAPFAVAVAPQTDRVVVTSEGDGVVFVLDASLEVQHEVAVGPEPRAVAIDSTGSTAWVTQFTTRGAAGEAFAIDLDSGDVSAPVSLAEDPGPDTSSSGRGVPNLLGGLAIDPAGATLWVAGLKANTNRGPFLDGQPLEPRNRIRGMITPVLLGAQEESLERRIDTNDAGQVSALAFSPRGRYAYLAHPGAGRLSVYDVPMAELVDTSDGSTVNFEARVDAGHVPHGVVVDGSNERVYVASDLSRAVIVYDLADLTSPAEIAVVSVTDEPLAEELALGKRLFHRSREPVHSDQNYIACASCHPDGGNDGRTWDFTQFGEGLRNTIDLLGHGGTDHGPVHWSANFDEIQDFENDIQGGFGGDGLLGGEDPHPPLADEPNAGRTEELDALAAYVTSLSVAPRSPFREANGGLSEAALRGRDLFFDEGVGCVDCHVPPRFTDSTLTEDPADFILHDVGTLTEGSGMRLGERLVGLDTPTVLGVWATPPYLHDGSAPTLRHVLTDANPRDAHGVTSSLDEGDLDDLVAYLRSLQGAEDEIPDDWDPGDDDDDDDDDDVTGGSVDGTTGDPGEGDGTSGGESGEPAGTSTGTPVDVPDEGDTDDPSATDSSSSCACRGAPTAPSPVALLLLGLGVARRRRRKV